MNEEIISQILKMNIEETYKTYNTYKLDYNKQRIPRKTNTRRTNKNPRRNKRNTRTKMKLLTTFWENHDITTWQQRIAHIYSFILIIFTINATYYIFTQNYILMTLNLIPITANIIILLSYNKYKNQEQ